MIAIMRLRRGALFFRHRSLRCFEGGARSEGGVWWYTGLMRFDRQQTIPLDGSGGEQVTEGSQRLSGFVARFATYSLSISEVFTTLAAFWSDGRRLTVCVGATKQP